MSLRKYFIAIVMPEPLYSEIEALKQSLSETHGLKGALRSPAHITLHRPFEWKEEKEQELISKISDFRFQIPANIVLNGFDFFEPRVVFVNVVPNEHLKSLHDQLSRYAREHLRLFNEVEDMRGFHPHVTIAFRDLKKPKFYELQKEFTDKPFNGTFQYSGFSLLKLEKTWEVLQTFPA